MRSPRRKAQETPGMGSAWEGETFRWPLAAGALQIAPRRCRIEI